MAALTVTVPFSATGTYYVESIGQRTGATAVSAFTITGAAGAP